MTKKESKKCKDCYWIHEFPFFEGWYSCLFPDKNKPKSRESTKLEFKICPYSKKSR